MIIIAFILLVIVLLALSAPSGKVDHLTPKKRKRREELVKHFEQQAKREGRWKSDVAEKKTKEDVSPSEQGGVEEQKQPDRYTRFLTFNVQGTNFADEKGKEYIKSLKVGDPVLLVPEFYNPYDCNAVAVHVNGVRIGYMPASLAATVAKTIFPGHSANYTLCQVSEVVNDEVYEMPIIELAVFAKTADGKDQLISDREPDILYVEPIEGCGQDLVDDILHRGYLLSIFARQMIYSHPEWYEEYDGESSKDEDDEFFISFVNRIYFGGIKEKEDYQDFLKDVRRDRVRGDNKILIKRIKHYLKIRNIEFL